MVRKLLLAGAFLSVLPAAARAAGPAEPPVIRPLPSPEAGAEIGRDAALLVVVDGKGGMTAAARTPAGLADPPLPAHDPAVRAVLNFLGLRQPQHFAVLGVENPQCIKICELVGGDYFCRKVCS